MMPGWIENEFKDVDFGDKRLATRLKVASNSSVLSRTRHRMLAKEWQH